MNCTNCAGTLLPVSGRDHCVCEFCSTFHFPQPLKDSADRIKPLGQRSKLDCPVCRKPLSLGSIERVEILYCANCRGLLSICDDFVQIIESRRSKWAGAEDSPQPLDPKELERRIDCPVCRRPMEVHPYYGPGNAVIDSCSRCRVVWLDHGEMAVIERAPGKR
jgi:Zn-finger nucleic acid-binding protein